MNWETCPNCGLLFETKKIKGENPMQVEIRITGEVTTESAPLLAQLIAGKSQEANIENPTPAASAATVGNMANGTTSAAAPAVTAAATAPAATSATRTEPLTAEQVEELRTKIREKGSALRGAGKSDVMRAAIKALGYEKLTYVPSEQYPALWEVLKDAG